MATTQTQLRRGTFAQNQAMTPAEGEVIVDLTNDRLSLGDGLVAGGRPQASAADIQQQKFTYITVAGSNTLTATAFPTVASYSAGHGFKFLAVADNTGAVTLNVDSVGAIQIYKNVSGTLTALVANDIKTGIVYEVVYNGTSFQLMNTAATAPTPSGLVLLSTNTGSGSNFEFNGLFSTSYSGYKFVFNNVKSSSSASLLTEFRQSASYLTTNYNNHGLRFVSGTGSIAQTANGELFASVSTSTGCRGVADFVPDWTGNATLHPNLDASIGSSITTFDGIIRRTSSGITYDGIRFRFVAGTASGTIRMYGLTV